MAISVAQQGEVARILGFPNLSPATSLNMGYPAFSSPFAQWQPYAMLLARLAQASPNDEVQMFGAESALFGQFFSPASLAFTFSTPSSIATGVVLQLNLNGTVVTYTTVSGDTPTSVVHGLVAAIQANPTIAQAFMVNPNGPTLTVYYVSGLGVNGNGVQCLSLSSDPSALIQIGSAAPAQMANGSTSGGQMPPGPRFQDPSATEPVYGYVPIIRILESDLINARINLDTLKADVWEPRQDEVSARAVLWREYRKQLADRLSVPLDPDIVGNGRQIAQRVV